MESHAFVNAWLAIYANAPTIHFHRVVSMNETSESPILVTFLNFHFILGLTPFRTVLDKESGLYQLKKYRLHRVSDLVNKY